MQCEKRFFLPASAPALFNLVWIGGAILCRDLELEEAIRRLALTMNLGCFAQWLITIPYTWGAGKGSWKFWSADIKRLVQKMSLGFTGVAAIQVNNAIDPFFALAADTEGPNYLWYAIRLKQVPLALFGIAISSALLPPLSRAIQSGATAKFRHFFHEAISKCSFLMIPITFFTLLAPIPIIDAVFGYGEFDGRAVNETATVLVCYMIGLLPATFILIQAQVFFALGDFRTPAKGALLAMCTNSVLNYLLIFSFGWGPASVALATSISSLLNGLYLYNKLPVDKPSMVPPLFHAATASAFAALTTGWISQSIILPEQSILLVATLGLTFSCLYLASATLINASSSPPPKRSLNLF
jgi:putative peptidoglycan lipid II flippase